MVIWARLKFIMRISQLGVSKWRKYWEFSDRVLLPVSQWRRKTSRISWCFQKGIGSESDRKLFDVIYDFEKDLVSVIDVASKKIRIKRHNQHERLSSDSELSKGKIIWVRFSRAVRCSDCQIKVLTKEGELIGRLPKSGLYFNEITN